VFAVRQDETIDAKALAVMFRQIIDVGYGDRRGDPSCYR
jgi:hypothetical protein